MGYAKLPTQIASYFVEAAGRTASSLADGFYITVYALSGSTRVPIFDADLPLNATPTSAMSTQPLKLSRRRYRRDVDTPSFAILIRSCKLAINASFDGAFPRPTRLHPQLVNIFDFRTLLALRTINFTQIDMATADTIVKKPIRIKIICAGIRLH
jgi:hypothetical protein